MSRPASQSTRRKVRRRSGRTVSLRQAGRLRICSKASLLTLLRRACISLSRCRRIRPAVRRKAMRSSRTGQASATVGLDARAGSSHGQPRKVGIAQSTRASSTAASSHNLRPLLLLSPPPATMLFWLVLALQWALLVRQCRTSGTSLPAALDLPFLAALLASVLWQGRREGWIWTSALALCSSALAYGVRTKHVARLRRHEAKPQAPKDASKSSVVYRYKMVRSPSLTANPLHAYEPWNAVAG